MWSLDRAGDDFLHGPTMCFGFVEPEVPLVLSPGLPHDEGETVGNDSGVAAGRQGFVDAVALTADSESTNDADIPGGHVDVVGDRRAAYVCLVINCRVSGLNLIGSLWVVDREMDDVAVLLDDALGGDARLVWLCSGLARLWCLRCRSRSRGGDRIGRSQGLNVFVRGSGRWVNNDCGYSRHRRDDERATYAEDDVSNDDSEGAESEQKGHDDTSDEQIAD